LGGSVQSRVAIDTGRNPDERSVSFLLSGATSAERDRGESKGALRSRDRKTDGTAWGVGLHHEGLWRRWSILSGLRAPRQGN